MDTGNILSESRNRRPSARALASVDSENFQDQQRISAFTAPNIMKYRQMATELIRGTPISKIIDYLNTVMKSPGYRVHLTSGDTADKECVGARNMGSTNLQKYKGLYEANKDGRAYTTTDQVEGNLLFNASTKEFATVAVSNIKNQPDIVATFMGECGDCWLCNRPVYYYVGESKDTYDNISLPPIYVTSTCGECDHVGAIVASALAGMLKSQNYMAGVAGYKVSHIHCNQQKSNDVSMMFDKNKQEWIVDEEGITKILGNILGSQINGNEYDPQYIDWFEQYRTGKKGYRTGIQTQMINSIRHHTQEWCEEANTNLKYMEQQQTGNIASTLVDILLTIDRIAEMSSRRSERAKTTSERAIERAKTARAKTIEAMRAKAKVANTPRNGGRTVVSQSYFELEAGPAKKEQKSIEEPKLIEAKLEAELETELEAELAELEAKEQKLIKEEQDLIEQVQKDYNEVYAENSTLVEELLTNLSKETGGAKQSRKSKSNKNKTKKNKSNKNKSNKNKSNKNKSNKNKTKKR